MIGCVPKTTSRWGLRNWTLSQPWKSKQVRSILFRDTSDVLSEARRTTTKNSHRIRALSCCSREALYQSNYEREMQSSGTAAQQEEYASNKHDTNRHLAAGGRPEMSLSKGDLSLLAADCNNLLGPINAQCIRYAASLSNTTKRRRFMPIYFSLIVCFLH